MAWGSRNRDSTKRKMLVQISRFNVVSLFFIVSGFVIPMSLKGENVVIQGCTHGNKPDFF